MPPLELPAGVLTKSGVILRGLDWRRMYPAIRAAARVWLSHDRPLVITSGLDGRHRKGSRHYSGLALDFRTRDLANRTLVFRQLQEALAAGFQVMMERDHIHVEYDPSHPDNSKITRVSRFGRKASERKAAKLAEGIP